MTLKISLDCFFLDVFPGALDFAQSTTYSLPLESPREDSGLPGSKCKQGVPPDTTVIFCFLVAAVKPVKLITMIFTVLLWDI